MGAVGSTSGVRSIIIDHTTGQIKTTFAKPNWTMGAFSALAFVLGGVTSIVSGYIGMMIAVKANSRTALQAQRGYAPAFKTAFRSGAVMGFSLCALAMLVLIVLILIVSAKFSFPEKILYPAGKKDADSVIDPVSSNQVQALFECVASYGLGGSSIALFGRVGGGIYTKAADVGADLVGKTLKDLKEDDPENPGTIADNVGDNVGDIAGMGADLFESYIGAIISSMIIGSTILVNESLRMNNFKDS